MACVDQAVWVDHDVGPIIDLDDFRGLSGARRDAAIMSVEREVRRLQGVQAAMIAEVRRSCSFVDDGHRDVTSWTQAVLNSARPTAQHKVLLAAMLDDLPVLSAALADGAVGADQLRLLVRLHANDRCRQRLPEFEEMLVEYARSLTYREFRLVCQRFGQHADPDGGHRDHELSREKRSVSCSRVGVGHVLTATGDAVSGDILNEILDAHAAAELETDLQRRRDMFGAGSTAPLVRTARQRRYDALMTIFLKAAGSTTTTDRTPLVNIFCTEASLNNAIRDHAETVFDLRLAHAETAAGSPVDPRDLLAAALIGNVRRVMVDSVGRVTDLGRRSRLFTGAAREAVLLGGDCCDAPGCEQRGAFVQVDHLTPWSRPGGETNSDNGAAGCGHHNRFKHTHHITVTRDHTGWHQVRPDGTEIAPRGH